MVIVDEDAAVREQVAKTFAAANYNVATAISGTDGVEKIMEAPPDLALINLQLSDMPGDLIVFRLQQMAKTRRIACLLYLKKNYDHQRVVTEKIGSKTGVTLLYEYVKPDELVQAAADMFKRAKND